MDKKVILSLGISAAITNDKSLRRKKSDDLRGSRSYTEDWMAFCSQVIVGGGVVRNA